MNVKYYSQKDPRWASIPYTIDGDAIETIGYSGCGPTCAAMLVASVCDPAVTPPDMCNLAIQTGTRTANDGTDWAFFGQVAIRYGLAYKQTVYNAEALECVQAGGVVICSMGPGRWTNGGHFILWYGMDGDYVLINDPQSTAAARSRAPIADMYAQSRQYFCFYVAAAAAETEENEVQTTTITAKMNGIATPLTSIVYKDENYIRVRDLADAQQDDKLTVEWDAATETVIINSK